jgi:hypothetical protein
MVESRRCEALTYCENVGNPEVESARTLNPDVVLVGCAVLAIR